MSPTRETPRVRPPYDPMRDDPACREAFRHGQTLERLHRAAKTLLDIHAICISPRRRSKAKRLLDIEVIADLALSQLSARTGGVIDDISPLGEAS